MIPKNIYILTLIGLLMFLFGCDVEIGTKSLPKVSTIEIENITSISATVRVTLIDDGNADIISKGAVWDKNGDPIIENCIGKSLITRNHWDPYNCYLNSLEPETQYYVRAFATNSKGTTYGNVLSFTTLASGVGDFGVEYGEFTDSRDGNTYKTVQIGNQNWMAENLKYLPMVYNDYDIYSEEPRSSTEPRYYVYTYAGTIVAEAIETDHYKTYGVLYNWPATMNLQDESSANPSGVQGVCPSGWHVPSAAEWDELENYLADNGYNYDGTIGGGNEKIAKALSSTKLWKESYRFGDLGTDSTMNNKSGFNALPGGLNHFSGIIGYKGCWWTSTLGNGVVFRSLYRSNPDLNKNNYGERSDGFSVRCVQD